MSMFYRLVNGIRDRQAEQMASSERSVASIMQTRYRDLESDADPISSHISPDNASHHWQPPMPFTETYTAMEQGAIDGMTNPLLNILDGKYNEVSKHLTITNHMYTPQAVIVSKKFWDKLSPTEQKILRDAAQETAIIQRKVARDEAAKVLAELKKRGMNVVELPPAEVAKLRERSKPVLEKYTKELGAIVPEMLAAVEQARAAK